MRRLTAIVLLIAPLLAHAGPMTYMVSHGAAANPITALGWGLLGLSIFVSAFIAVAVLIGIWWKRGTGGYDEKGWPVLSHGRNGLPWLTIGVPVSIVLLLLSAIWTFYVLGVATAAPGHPRITVEVIGHQWWWEIHYDYSGHPKRTFETANEIHIPVGVPVNVHITSGDVIHSFWVPQLAGKTDAIPGQINHAWLEADRPGVYLGQCAEFCGLQHAHMAIYVVAQSKPAFEAWWAHQLQPAAGSVPGLAGQGEQEFRARCAICHSVRGVPGSQGQLGPDLTHLMGRRTIAAGTLTNTPGNLAAWVSDAPAQKPGVDMPAENLTGPQLQALLAYLKTLK
jgi:cytochrome c oxidase subunit 2